MDRVELAGGGIVEIPTWFGNDDRPLFGWFVHPRDGRIRGAVVLCQPLGEEATMAYRTFRTLSQELARRGLLAVRFDYDGTGDSAGAFNDPDRVEAWIASVADAVVAARAWGADHVSVVGMRMGALFAAVAAARHPLELDDLVLWDPCASGRTFLREQQMLHAGWIETRERAPEGWVETPSYRFAPETAAGLRKLAIDEPTHDHARAARTVVLSRPDRSPAPAVVRAFPPEETEWRDARAQDGLMDVSTMMAAVPRESVAEIAELIAHRAPGASASVVAQLRQRARWNEDGHPVEESVCLRGAGADLFAIETCGAHSDPHRPVVVFGNVAAERHLGTGGLWVRAARILAAHGFTSYRFDHSGVGDSATRDRTREDHVYAPEWPHDVGEVARSVAGEADAVAVGMCSSAMSALEAGSRGDVARVIAINAGLLDGGGSEMAKTWRTFARRPRWLYELSQTHRGGARKLSRLWMALDPRGAPLWSLRSVVARGTRVCLLVGDEDVPNVTQNRAWTATWGRRLRSSDLLRIEFVANADHSLRVGSGQDAVLAAILRELDAVA
jgi:pimeloyl-ACP methyl ester carboxylesterase